MQEILDLELMVCETRAHIDQLFIHRLCIVRFLFSVDVQDFLPRPRRGASEDQIEFEQLPFGQPLYILFSSGTSGPPKCIVHCGGVSVYCLRSRHVSLISVFVQGVLLQNMKDDGIALGMGIDDTYFQFTTVSVFLVKYQFPVRNSRCDSCRRDG